MICLLLKCYSSKIPWVIHRLFVNKTLMWMMVHIQGMKFIMTNIPNTHYGTYLWITDLNWNSLFRCRLWNWHWKNVLVLYDAFHFKIRFPKHQKTEQIMLLIIGMFWERAHLNQITSASHSNVLKIYNKNFSQCKHFLQ